MPLAVKKWKKFQAFNRLRPPWIKLWHGLLTDRKFCQLPLPSQALLPKLWLLATEFVDGFIDLDDATIAWRVHFEIEEFYSAVEPAISAGFLTRHESLTESEREAEPTDSKGVSLERPTQSQSQSQRQRNIYKDKRENRVRARDQPFPTKWTLSDLERTYASDRGLDVDETFEHFKAHNISINALRTDWRRAWLAWCCKGKQLKGASDGKTKVNGNGAAHFARTDKPTRARTAARGLDKAIASGPINIRRPNGF